MCLIAFGWRVHPRYTLALIANRDEYHARPTAPAAAHPTHPDLYGGRDLQAGGGWLQYSTRRRLAAVTNVRDGVPDNGKPRSRGALVTDFVAGRARGDDYLDTLAANATEFGRFNLLLWDGEALQVASNHPQYAITPVSPGVHAMSNGAFDAPWPKAGWASQALADWLDQPRSRADAPDLASLFAALADTTPAPDALLPDTGVGLEMERFLSPPFVRSARYGTRCSTVVLVGERETQFVERRFDPDGRLVGETRTEL